MKKKRVVIIVGLILISATLFCQTGNISGVVVDNSGYPVQDAEVFIYGSSIRDMSDPNGNFYLTGIISGSPRYIICAVKNGYITSMQGEIDVPEGGTVTVNLTLQERDTINSYRSQFFELKMGYLIDHSIVTSEVLQPCEDAILDTLLYPESVKEYMRAGKYIDPSDPVIAALANDILMSIPDSLRTHQTEVARRVYIWVVTHIHYDLTVNYPGDLTCGNWQTMNGGWGHNFNDWCYEPQNVVEEERAICIEFERLASALLRALNIPARPAPLKAHPVTQWWVQLPDSTGYWANMETSRGSGEYWANGDSLAKFPSRQEHGIAFWWPNADVPIHMNWESGHDHLWQETSRSIRLERTVSGLSTAEIILSEFEQYGRYISSGTSPAPDDPNYEVFHKGFYLDMATMETGSELTCWFPIFLTSEYNEVLETAIWTSHPEWITDQWVEILSDPVSGESIDIQYISFHLQPLNESSNILLNAGFEEGEAIPLHWTEFMNIPGSAEFDRSSVAHNGEHSAHIAGNQPNTIASFRQTFPVVAGDHIKLNGWIQTQNLGMKAIFEIIFAGPGLLNPPPFPELRPKMSGTQDWTWVNGGATAPEGADSVTIACTLFGQGEAWFDDIQLSIWTSENTAIDENHSITPVKFELKQNYPNPFNPTTTISFSIHNDSKIEFTIYNIKGQKVKVLVNEELDAGTHHVMWDGMNENGKSVTSGIYFYRLKEGTNFSQTKRMLLLK